MAGIAFFDVDHTVVRRSTARRFLLLGAKLGIFPIVSLLLFPFYYLLYRTGRIGARFFRRDIPLLKGKSKKYLEQISKSSFNKKLIGDIYGDAQALIQGLKDSGKRVVFATSSIDIMVFPLAEYLGVKDVIATSLEFNNGVCTGRFKGIPIFKHEKMKRVVDFIEYNGLRPEDCSFYSDSINDLPLLEVVGNPVAVNPDRLLKRIALKKGWETIRFT